MKIKKFNKLNENLKYREDSYGEWSLSNLKDVSNKVNILYAGISYYLIWKLQLEEKGWDEDSHTMTITEFVVVTDRIYITYSQHIGDMSGHLDTMEDDYVIVGKEINEFIEFLKNPDIFFETNKYNL